MRKYTIKQIRELSDYELLKCIVGDRQNYEDKNTPLYTRLERILKKLENKKGLTQTGGKRW